MSSSSLASNKDTAFSISVKVFMSVVLTEQCGYKEVANLQSSLEIVFLGLNLCFSGTPKPRAQELPSDSIPPTHNPSPAMPPIGSPVVTNAGKLK